MKAKLLLLLCCLFAIEGWANSNDIHLEEFYKLKYCSTVVYMVPRA